MVAHSGLTNNPVIPVIMVWVLVTAELNSAAEIQYLRRKTPFSTYILFLLIVCFLLFF